jgi:hypothetical protein
MIVFSFISRLRNSTIKIRKRREGMRVLNPIERALYEELRNHHAEVRRTMMHEPVINIGIYYGELIDRAAVPLNPKNCGTQMGHIAEWCKEHILPPLNALAVNAESHTPGEGYDGAAGNYCHIMRWPEEVEAVRQCREYPALAEIRG